MSNTSTEKMVSQEQKLTHKDLMKVFWRSFAIECSFNYERMQGPWHCVFINPDYKEALQDQRKPECCHQTAYRILQYYTAGFHLGLGDCCCNGRTGKQQARTLIENAIRSVKSGLMGPLAGIGDSFFWGTFRVIAAGVGASMMVKGKPDGYLAVCTFVQYPACIDPLLLIVRGIRYGCQGAGIGA